MKRLSIVALLLWACTVVAQTTQSKKPHKPQPAPPPATTPSVSGYASVSGYGGSLPSTPKPGQFTLTYPTTPNLGLNVPLAGTPNWDVPLNANFTLLDTLFGCFGAGGTAGTLIYFNGTACAGVASTVVSSSGQIALGPALSTLGFQIFTQGNNFAPSQLQVANTTVANRSAIGAYLQSTTDVGSAGPTCSSTCPSAALYGISSPTVSQSGIVAGVFGQSVPLTTTGGTTVLAGVVGQAASGSGTNNLTQYALFAARNQSGGTITNTIGVGIDDMAGIGGSTSSIQLWIKPFITHPFTGTVGNWGIYQDAGSESQPDYLGPPVTFGTSTKLAGCATGTYLKADGTGCDVPSAAGAVITVFGTSGPNITALTVGSGNSIAVSGSGTNAATTLLGGTWAIPGTIGSTTPSTGAFTTLLASTSVTDSALTPGNCVEASTGGLLTTTTGACGGSGISGATLGQPLIATAAGTATSSPAYLDCSQFAGSDDSVKLQACFVALNSLDSITGIADGRGLTGCVWSLNPYNAASIPASGTLLLGGGCSTITVAVPFVDAPDWSIVGPSVRANIGNVGLTIEAGASFQATYSTGTITVGTPGASEVITGSGTTWASSMLGCAFYGANGGTNSTYGIITAVGSATALTLGWGTNLGTGAAGGSPYKIACPVHAHGSGAAAAAGAQYGMSATNINFDCNNVAGCIGDLNWYGNQGTYDTNVGIHNFTNIGLDLENQFQNSGPWNVSAISAGSGCSASTLLAVIRGNSQPFAGLYKVSTSKGACATNPTVGIDDETNNVLMQSPDLGGGVTGFLIGGNVTCPVDCAILPRVTSGTELDDITVEAGVGTTGISISNALGTPGDTTIRNLNNATTNGLVDSANNCTETTNRLGFYAITHAGKILYSSSNISGCTDPSILSIPTGTATFSAGSGVTSVVCATGFSCNNSRGTLTIVGGTATTGTVATVSFSGTLSAAPACFVNENGGSTNFGIGNSAPTTTAFNITAGISVIGATFNVNYQCQP